MSVEIDLFTYFNAQWGTRTKFTLPNTNTAQSSGSYTDSDTVLDVNILDVGRSTLGFPVNQSTPVSRSYILQCNIVGLKGKASGTVYGHADYLTSIFENTQFTQGDHRFNFEEARRGQAVPDETYFIVPWTCPFFVFIE